MQCYGAHYSQRGSIQQVSGIVELDMPIRPHNLSSMTHLELWLRGNATGAGSLIILREKTKKSRVCDPGSLCNMGRVLILCANEMMVTTQAIEEQASWPTV